MRPPSGAGRANSGKAWLRSPLSPSRKPPAPPHQEEAPAGRHAERPPGPSAEASLLSCDDAAAKTPQKRRAAGGERHSHQPASARPRRARASPESPGGGGRRAEGGLGGGPERATKAPAPVAVVPERAGARFSGPREGWGGTRALGCPPRPQPPPGRPDGQRPPRPAQAHAASLPRAGPAPGPPARSSLALSRSLALARPPSWIRASSPRAAAAAFPLSRPPPPSPPPALTSAAHPGAAGRRPSFPPKVSGVLFPMWGGCYGVVAGGSGAGAAPSTELQS